MFKRVCLALLLFGILSGCGNESAESSDNQLKEEQPKIVATTVAATQIFDALDIELLGIPTSSQELPKRYQGVTEVGAPMNPDMEIIKTINPSIVYGTKTLQSEQEQSYKNAGLAVEFLDFTSIKNMMHEIDSLGETYDKKDEATKLNQGIQTIIDEVQAEVSAKEKPTVLLLMGVPGSYLVCTSHSFLGSLVELAGGKNVIQGEDVEYLASNTEYLQSVNPDIILRASHGMPEEVVEMFKEEFQTNDIWQHFDAVKNSNVYDLDYELFGMTATLNSTDSLKELVKIMYGEE